MSLKAVIPSMAWASTWSAPSDGTVAVVAEQANHAEELADRDHEDARIDQPQRGGQHREARVDGAEHPVQRPRDHHVEGDHEDQTHDSEPEQSLGRRDVGGGLGGIALGHQSVDDDDVAEDGDDRHEQEGDSGGEARVADRPLSRRTPGGGRRSARVAVRAGTRCDWSSRFPSSGSSGVPEEPVALSSSLHVRCTRTLYVTRTVYVCQGQLPALTRRDMGDDDG